MLNIITAAYRFENLTKVYNSILLNEDITWHITKSNKREPIEFDFIKSDGRVKLYNIECEDSEGAIKHRNSLSKIDCGYFCFLDDDTLFHENMYIKYKECEEDSFEGMLIGQQLSNKGEIRINAHYPKYQFIDIGNVLSHHSCLKEVTFPTSHTPRVNAKDFLFWDSVYNFYDKKCAIWNQPISHYNKLRET